MTINTKFNKGDIGWCMRDNRPIEFFITDIKIEVISYTSIRYGGNWLNTKWTMQLNENQLFATKEELLKSL